MIDVLQERAIYREISGKALAKPVAHLKSRVKPVAQLCGPGQESRETGLTGGENFAGHFAPGVNDRG